MNMRYFQLTPGSELPDISGLKPFLTVLVIEENVNPGWREMVSRWLVKSGCIYMMAWGEDCSDWDDAVDLANIAQFENGEIPEDELVVTSGHGNETLNDVFWQAKNSAEHACVEFSSTMILNISKENKEKQLLELYTQA